MDDLVDESGEGPTFFGILPGSCNDIRVRAWRCDHCSDTHVVLYVKCLPPEGIDDTPFYGAFDLTEEAALSLIAELPFEMTHPAPGTDGGITLPMVPF